MFCLCILTNVSSCLLPWNKIVPRRNIKAEAFKAEARTQAVGLVCS